MAHSKKQDLIYIIKFLHLFQTIPSGRNKTRSLCNKNCVKDKCHVLLIFQYIKKKEIQIFI